MINEYVKEVKNVQEMKRLLKLYVRNNVFNNRGLPDIRNRRYFPTISTIRAHMVSARRKMQLSVIDQEALTEKIHIWKQEDPSIEIFFRPKSAGAVNNDDTKDNIEVEKQEMKFKNEDSVNKDDRIEGDIEEEEQEMKFKNEDSVHSLLFVYQIKWQRRLFQRYSGDMLLLDATYKTTRYVLPLFVHAVKTNVDYQIFETFITENETKQAIKEALTEFKEWNSSTSPKFCMTDYCNEEIEVLEETFVGM